MSEIKTTDQPKRYTSGNTAIDQPKDESTRNTAIDQLKYYTRGNTAIDQTQILYQWGHGNRPDKNGTRENTTIYQPNNYALRTKE